MREVKERGLGQRVGSKAISLLHDRIALQGRDGAGKKLPPLAKRKKGTGYDLVYADSDPAGKVARSNGTGGRIKIEGVWKTVRWSPAGGYPELKKRRGARPVRDLTLTGALWESLTPQFKVSKGGIDLRLYFARSSKVEGGGTKGRRSVRNRDKAEWVQFAGRGGGEHAKGSGRRLFRLMVFTDAEIAILRDMVLGRLSLGPLRSG